MSVQHPLPFKAHNEAPTNYYGWQVRDAKDQCVATGLTQATALEIVAAVNGREKLVEALMGFVDGECYCHEVGTNKPCVQCVGRAALSEGGGQ